MIEKFNEMNPTIIKEVIKSGFNLKEDKDKKDTKILMIFDTLK